MNKFKKVLYNITRPYAKKFLTGNLGKVVEDDKKITCYVKRSKIKKKDFFSLFYYLGIGENQEKVAKVFKLNKPICYVIDGIELKKKLIIISGYNNCEVTIKNCDFGLDLYIHVNGKCTLDNTNITLFSNLSIVATDLVIKNMDSEHINAISSESNVCFKADNSIEVIDSNIGSQRKNINDLILVTNELNIVNSNIVGKEVVCKSSVINADDKSSLIATDEVNLQTDDFSSININAPIIVLNGEEISNEKKSIALKKLIEPLALKRLELVNLLKKVKTQFENINTKKILEYQEELNVQPISKVLKK